MAKYGNKKTWLEFMNKAPENPKYYPAWNITLSDDANQVNQQLTDTSVQNLPRSSPASPPTSTRTGRPTSTPSSKIDVKVYEDAVNAGIKNRLANW